MKALRRFSVGGNSVSVPEDRLQEFEEIAKRRGDTPDEIDTYRVDSGSGSSRLVRVPRSREGDFMAIATKRGDVPYKLQSVSLDDGRELDFDPVLVQTSGALEAYAHSVFRGTDDAGRVSRRVSRKQMEDAGIPEEFGRSAEERMALIEGIIRQNPELGRYTQDAYDKIVRDVSAEDRWQSAKRRAEEAVSSVRQEAPDVPISEQLANLAALPADAINSAWNGAVEGMYGIETAAGNILSHAGAETVGNWLKSDAKAGTDSFTINQIADTTQPGAINKVAQTVKDVAHVTGEFAPGAAIPGYGAAVIASGGANKTYDTYDTAVANGATPEKALGLALASGGIDIAQNAFLMGRWKGIFNPSTSAAVQDGVARSFLKRLGNFAVETGRTAAGMGAGAGAQNAVQQVAEGADSPDALRVANAAVGGAAEGALFHVVNSGVHAAHRKAMLDPAERMRARREAEEAARSNRREMEKPFLERKGNEEARDELRGRIAEYGLTDKQAEAVYGKIVEGVKDPRELNDPVEMERRIMAETEKYFKDHPEELAKPSTTADTEQRNVFVNETKAQREQREAATAKINLAETEARQRAAHDAAEKAAVPGNKKRLGDRIVKNAEEPSKYNVGDEVNYKGDNDFKGKYTETIDLMTKTHSVLHNGEPGKPEEFYSEFSEIEKALTPKERTEYNALMRKYILAKSAFGPEYDAMKAFEERVGINGHHDWGYTLDRPGAEEVSVVTEANPVSEPPEPPAAPRQSDGKAPTGSPQAAKPITPAKPAKSVKAAPATPAGVDKPIVDKTEIDDLPPPTINQEKAGNAVYNLHKILQLQGEQKKLYRQYDELIAKKDYKKADKIAKTIDAKYAEEQWYLHHPGAGLGEYEKTLKAASSSPKPARKKLSAKPTPKAEPAPAAEGAPGAVEPWSQGQYNTSIEDIAEGKPVSVKGFPAGEASARKKGAEWQVFDNQSGAKMGYGRTKKAAIENAEKRIAEVGQEQLKKSLELARARFNASKLKYENPETAAKQKADADRESFREEVSVALTDKMGNVRENLEYAAGNIVARVREKYKDHPDFDKISDDLDRRLSEFDKGLKQGSWRMSMNEGVDELQLFAESLAEKYEIPGYEGKIEAPRYNGRRYGVESIDSPQDALYARSVEYAGTEIDTLFDPIRTRDFDVKKLTEADHRALKSLEKDFSKALENLDEKVEFDRKGKLTVDAGDEIKAFEEIKEGYNRFLEQAERYQHLKRDKTGRPLLSKNINIEPTADEGAGRSPVRSDASKLQRIDAKAAPDPEQEISDRLDLTRLDPKRRSDPKVLAYAKKNGRKVTNGTVLPDTVRAYDEHMTEQTAKQAKHWFPDMKIVAHKYGEHIERGQHVIDLRDTAGHTLGWFDPNSKEVHLLPGADPRTVAHEIMWHGTRDFITTEAAKGDAKAQKFLDMMHDVENNVPASLKRQIIAAYTSGTKAPSADTLRNEFGAWFTMGKGGAALEKALQTAEGRNWFAKAMYTVKEMYKERLIKKGGNRVDLAAIDGMSRDEFVDFLADQFAGGKTLGFIKGFQKTLSTDETRFQAWRRKTYDQNAAIRDLERDIEKKTGRKISVDDSVEAENALKYGRREAANIEVKGKMEAFRKTLNDNDIHYADLEYYAACKAAADRDAKVDARNIEAIRAKGKEEGWTPTEIADAINNYRSTNGSHIDPREARRIVDEIENGPDAQAYKNAYKELRKIIDETLDIQVREGLVDPASAAEWRKAEPNYVPFKNEYDPETGDWDGRGMSTRNFVRPEHRMAKGRQSAAGDIIAHVFMDHQAAKHRAIENAVRQKFAELVRQNPELGKVEKLDKDATRDIERTNPNVIVFKKGGSSYAIRLEGKRGEALANAFTQVRQLDMRWADKIGFRQFSRWSAGMATRYSLTFGIRNTLKDNIELANIVYAERGFIEGSKWMGRYAKSRAKMAKTLAKYITTGKIDASTAEGKTLREYIDAGGSIAGGTRAEAFDTIKKSLDPKSIEREMKRGNSKPRIVSKHLLRSIAYFNEYAEMATRVNAFATERAMGKSAKEAALFSRRVTVDFNRHGDWTPATNLFRLFSNSTLGATARAAVAFAKSKPGRRIALAHFVKGFALALLEGVMNRDDDEKAAETGEATGRDVSEYDRRTALLYWRHDGKFYKVAQHESPFSLFSYAGDCAGRWVCGELSGEEVAKNLGVSTAEVATNLLPFGSVNFTSSEGGLDNDIKAAFVSSVPTALQPLAELGFDVDYKGDKIFKTNFDKYEPDSSNSKAHTPDWAKDTAKWFNEATGGNENRKGWFDVAPETIQKLVEGYGKNALRDVTTAYNFGAAVMSGDLSGLDPRNTPVKRDFVRPLDGNDNRYFKHMDEHKADREDFEKNLPSRSYEENVAYLREHPDSANNVHKALSRLETAINRLRKMESGYVFDAHGKPHERKWTDAEKENFRKSRLALQAKYIKLMESQRPKE